MEEKVLVASHKRAKRMASQSTTPRAMIENSPTITGAKLRSEDYYFSTGGEETAKLTYNSRLEL